MTSPCARGPERSCRPCCGETACCTSTSRVASAVVLRTDCSWSPLEYSAPSAACTSLLADPRPRAHRHKRAPRDRTAATKRDDLRFGSASARDLRQIRMALQAVGRKDFLGSRLLMPTTVAWACRSGCGAVWRAGGAGRRRAVRWADRDAVRGAFAA